MGSLTGKKFHRFRRSGKWLDRELKSIYGDGRELRSFRRGRGHNHRWLIGLTIFFAVLAGVAWVGFFIFEPFSRFQGAGVVLKVDGPEKLVSGEEVSYIISYENKENAPLGNISVSALTSRGFALKKAEPEPSGKGTWELGTLGRGEKGAIVLTGVVSEGVGSVVTVQATFSYTPANFNSEFQRVATLASQVTDSKADFVLEGPPKIVPGEIGIWTMRIKYDGLAILEKAEARLFPSPKFIFLESQPHPGKNTENEIIWPLGNLTPQSEKKIVIKGTFSSEATGLETETATLGFLDNEGGFILQKRAELTTEIQKGDVVLMLIVNGGAGDRTEALGSDLRYSLTVRNQGDETVYNSEPALNLTERPSLDKASLLDWNALEISGNGKRIKNRLVWNKEAAPELGELRPGAEVTFDVRLKTVSETLPTNDRNYSISSSAEVKFGKRATKTVQSKLITVRVSSNLAVAVAGRYYSDENIPLGSGPIPPKVGATTTYRLIWTASNSLHEISDLTVSARLPEGVIWTGKSMADIGQISWDEDTRVASWSVGTLPLTLKTSRADFEVAIVPRPDKVGKVLTLLEPGTVQGKDEEVGTIIFQTFSAVTTDLDGDSEAEGKGTVEAK